MRNRNVGFDGPSVFGDPLLFGFIGGNRLGLHIERFSLTKKFADLILHLRASGKTPNALASKFRAHISDPGVESAAVREVDLSAESRCNPMDVIHPIYRAALMCAIFLSPGFAQTAARRDDPYLRQASITETSELVHITANSPRPLLQTLDALRRKYGWVINYEDPPYTSSFDIVEKHDDPSQLLLPAGGNFDVEFPGHPPRQDQTLQLIVDAYNQTSNPGRFELHTTQGRLNVVGTSDRSGTNTLSPLHPLLDTLLAVPVRQRTIADSVNLLCHMLTVQNHTTVSVGIWPKALVAYTTVKIGGDAVPARELLSQSLQAARRNLYWSLLFDPGLKGYVLNIHTAKP